MLLFKASSGGRVNFIEPSYGPPLAILWAWKYRYPYVIFMYLGKSDSDIVELSLHNIPWNVDISAATLAQNALQVI